MNSIKSVRVRRGDTNDSVLDIKVTIYDDGNNGFLMDGVNNTRIILKSSYKKDGIYKNFSIDDFINNFINTLSKSENILYSIVQNPWSDNLPGTRSYGFDPYYINNGASIYVYWSIGTTTAGGKIYSDQNGNEINVDTEISKTVKIIGNGLIFEISDDGSIKYSKDIKKNRIYSSTIKDKDIINETISKWNSLIPGYNLEICSPSNETCSLIEFKDPLKPISDKVESPISTNENTTDKPKLIASVLNEKIKVKFDFAIRILLGDISEKNNSDEYVFNDENSGLDPEFSENSFEGSEEIQFEWPQPIELGDVGDSTPGGDLQYTPSGNFKGGVIKGFNIDRAVSALNRNSSASSKGSCAKYVRFALEAGGVNTNGRPVSAKDYDDFLQRRGFSIVGRSGYSPKVGDIMVFESFSGRKFHQHGHIQMWNGERWISDFRQRGDSIWCGSDYRDYKPSYSILRMV